MYKVVLNRCYGGFGLSTKAEKLYWERKLGKKIFVYSQDYRSGNYRKITDIEHTSRWDVDFATKDYGDADIDYLPANESFCIGDVPRHDPVLVDIVEELKDEANGERSKLVVAEINTPMYRIENHDGMECIHTPEDTNWIVIETKELSTPELTR